MRTQTEKVNILRKEYAIVTAKLVTTEQENEALLHKADSLSWKIKELEDLVQEKDAAICSLQNRQDSLQADIEELKKIKDTLMKTIEEKDGELERIYRVSKFISPKKTESKAI